MAIQVQLRRGTATQNNAFTGAIGELSFDTTNNQLRVHDGSTAGGFKIGTGNFPTGTNNVALGNTALDDLDSGSPGGNNTAVGHDALTANTTASFNTAIGVSAGSLITTGQKNTIVGSFDGNQGGLDIRTSNNHIVLSDGDGNPRVVVNDSGLAGIGVVAPESGLHLSDGTNVGSPQNSARKATLTIEAGSEGSADIQFLNASYNHLFFGDAADANIGYQVYDHTNNSMQFGVNAAERMRIDSSGNVGIGVTPVRKFHLHESTASDPVVFAMTTNGTGATTGDGFNISIDGSSGAVNLIQRENESMQFYTNGGGNERMRIDSSGNILIGKTVTSSNTAGTRLVGASAPGYVELTRAGGNPLYLNRQTNDGNIIRLDSGGVATGGIGVYSGDLFVVNAPYDGGGAGLRYNSGFPNILPCNGTGADRDNAIDLGHSSVRFDDVYATNGTIQTSDEREKQQIASLTDAEMTAAKAISKLFKTFKWNDSVAENGDNARTHAGVIAQQVETAMSDAGLDAGNYAFFISTTWWETQTEVAAVEAVAEELDEDGNVVTEAVEAQEAYTRTDTYDTQEEAPEGATERNRKGIRYPELLSFIGAATEQRLTSIEARLDALEG
jgi:hypothetical protein